MQAILQAARGEAMVRIATCILTVAVSVAPAGAAQASGAGRLTGDWGGARDALAASGFSLRADATFATQGVAAGAEDRAWDGSGRGDLFVDIDSGRLGLWQGTGLHTHVEIRFADPRSNFGGQLLSSNTGALTPPTEPFG
jgi:carbohydrate-selective porin OprB